MVQQFLTDLPMGDGGASQVAITLSTILNAAVDDQLIGRNPCKVQSVQDAAPAPEQGDAVDAGPGREHPGQAGRPVAGGRLIAAQGSGSARARFSP